MKKAIVTTTINPPTKAIQKFVDICREDNWHLFVVADKKTPSYDWQFLITENPLISYVTPEMQEKISQQLSELIGWNCIQRRNFGLLLAYKQGYDVIATVDDDNIPLRNWGKNVIVGQEVVVDQYSYKSDVPEEQILFDPLGPTKHGMNLWHRGFPIQLLKSRTRLNPPKKVKRRVLVQADLWNGEPDIDAICRIFRGRSKIRFEVEGFYAGDKMGPFNSQNTFLHRSVVPNYFLFPGIGRMDDIWAAYVLQTLHPGCVVYGPPSVYQERNEHDLVKDLEAEMIGYRHSLDFAKALIDAPTAADWALNLSKFLPRPAEAAYNAYRGLMNAQSEKATKKS